MSTEEHPATPEGKVLNALSPLPQVTEDERRRAVATQVRAVLAGTPRNLLSGILGASIIAGTYTIWNIGPNHRTHFLEWAWWLAIAAGLLRGARMTAIFTRQIHTDSEVMKEGRRVINNAAYCACVWGASAWIFLPASTVQAEAIVIIGIGLVLMGGAGAQAIYRPLMLTFIVITLAVFVAGLARIADQFHIFVGMAYILLGYVVVSFAQTQEEAVKAAIYLGFKTERLVEEIRLEQQATDRARKDAEHAWQQAELANQGKTTFLAAAGHDLRQPMHALVQYFGHLKRFNKDPGLAETIARVGKSLDSMQDLLDTILEVSKLMMGSVKPSLRSFAASELIDRIDAQMRPLAEDKGLRFEVFCDDCTVHTDEVLLERILRNLTLNAIRYTDAGYVAIRAKRRGGQVRFQVFDSGIGIPMDQRERVFEAFYQVENLARDRRKGLGLGLAIVKQLSELLELSVELRSKEGRGSIFSIELPVSKQVELVAMPTAVSKAHDFVKGSFVVLIDDDAGSLEATRTSLSVFGCRVLAAKSGLDAIERLQGQEFMPNLVISDYRLEGESGLDAIKMVVDNQKALFGDDFAIPALVLSGDTAPSELEKVRQAGLPMLHKPVKLDALYDAVNAELQILATATI